jgi:D-alanine-D-alanine ligase-like ATP-grasp enzyme
MKILILQSAPEDSAFDGLDPACVPEIYLRDHECMNVTLSKSTVASQLLALSREGFDVVINLCDGAWDENRVGAEVITILEKLGMPYTGADAKFYDPTRTDMKRVALAAGLSTPAWTFAYRMHEVLPNVSRSGLEYPLIVKHHNSYSSIGLTRESKVTDEAGLLQQAERMIETYGGCLIEEFVDGREFTVLVAENPDGEPITYQAVECCFPVGDDFKHFDLKWVDWEGLVWKPVTDAPLDARLRDMAKKVFSGLQGRGFGRLDVRSDPQGEVLQFLEINPNCGIFYPPNSFGSADEILAASGPRGHEEFLERLIACALRDAKAKQPLYQALYTKSRGFGLFAMRDIAEGEVVQVNEERETVLVSQQHVDKTFDSAKLADFAAYAWPLSERVFCTWHADPQKWEPINHSCDPNTWLLGLNTVARRPIAVNEELTIDYSTFCVSNASFPCSCGTKSCRGVVTGEDWLVGVDKYGSDHVSDCVRLLTARAMGDKVAIAE